MYPTEAYLLVRGPGRVLHVDPYRHELVDLARPCPEAVPGAAVVLVLTLRYWKNLYKYGDFAIRLGIVDTGVVLGRALCLGSETFGRARLAPDVDDAAVGACLGLDPTEEGRPIATPGCSGPTRRSSTSPGPAHPVTWPSARGHTTASPPRSRGSSCRRASPGCSGTSPASGSPTSPGRCR